MKKYLFATAASFITLGASAAFAAPDAESAASPLMTPATAASSEVPGAPPTGTAPTNPSLSPAVLAPSSENGLPSSVTGVPADSMSAPAPTTMPNDPSKQ